MSVQDDRGSRKKAWKAFQANYDDVFSLSDRLCSYCLTDQMVQALLTMTEYLKWPTRWISATGDIDSDLIDAFTSQLEWRLMNGCCDDNLPIQWQYTEDGTLQMSTNGGGTWVDAPLYDPRVYSTTFPPITGDDGDDKKCAAATGAADLLKEQVGDQITDDMTRFTLGELITTWVNTMIQSSNPFLALVTVITNQIFALVLAALVPALTDDVYDEFKCALYLNMADDATFTTAQWTAVRNDISSHIDGIAGIFLEHLVYLLGEKGLTNLVRAGGALTGDCDLCDSTCVLGDWGITIYSGVPIGTELSRGTHSITVQGTSHPDFGTPYNVMLTTDADNHCCVIFSIEILTGSDVQYFGRNCETTRWPGGPTGPIDIGVSNVNTLFLRGNSVPFTAKVTFS
jgi:hypothetical protein